ncbi:CRISPR-associated protein Cas1 [Thermodesulfatator indicus DSM 15286]|uniref:CRISPR-associated endonuclease Cas1 n=1 Tax=Thermodesulfatator indicus (strain DSM 15286 / JCM 11887 / CIR29812) TaxID=667014 RepID=F8A9H2_THEID|nr:type I-B CRISPR-associated endonuclease Cas1b [Thermodesulfatator indicus]AEH44117.1 CRISPR-associated protein Cas1 [Thermodesulfatator indicus DSM 15286]
MKRSLYIFNPGHIKREGNTLVFISRDGKKALPIETIDSLYVFAEVTFNKKLLEFLSQKKIPVHFFNYFEYYVGSYYPREYMNSGLITLRQAEYYLNREWRLGLARAFVYGALANMLFNLRTYSSRGKELASRIADLEKIIARLNEAQNSAELMALEGQARQSYYQAFDVILANPDFSFEVRTRRPPANRLNALISFGNSLIYVTALSEIYRTHLDPRIGYLHETNQRSFTLNLDLAEIFKPLIVDRVIFSLINRSEIKPEDFTEEMDGIYLKDKGTKKFLEAYEKRLSETIMHKGLGRKVSYRRLIRLECYKLYRHFLGDELYKPYVRTR